MHKILYVKLCSQLADSAAEAGGLTKAIVRANQRCSFQNPLFCCCFLNFAYEKFFCLVSPQGLDFLVLSTG